MPVIPCHAMARGKSGGPSVMFPTLRLTGFLFLSCLAALPLLGKDKAKDATQPGNPPSSSRHPKALFTTEKKKPSKAEQQSALADYGIPSNQAHKYVAEYRVPISLGGSNSYPNIEVLSKPQAELKHRVQKDLERKLHRGEISQVEAQQRIFNWNQEPIAQK
jgi:hypothetical protein